MNQLATARSCHSPCEDEHTRLVLVGPTPPPVHGVSVMTGELIGALAQLDLLADHLDTRDPRPHETIGRFDLTNVWLALRHSWGLHRLLTVHRRAAVYVPISQSALGYLRDALLVAIARAHRRRLYLHLHGADFRAFFDGTNAIMRGIIRLTLTAAHQLWILTPALAASFEGLIPLDRLFALENVVSDYLPSPATYSRSNGSPDTVRILYLGNMFPAKNCFDLLAALARLGSRAASWEVRVAGAPAPSLKLRLEREISSLQKAGVTIEAVGPVDSLEKRRQLEWADMFVYPTAFDGQPLVLLEALAAGLPVVSTRHGAIPQTIRHGAEGLLVDAGDIGALADAMVTLAENRDLRRSLGLRARARYERCYQPSRLTHDLWRLLHE